MDDIGFYLIVLGIILFIVFIIWLEWFIGKLIGKNVSRLTGIVLGIVLIIFGFSIITGIACIIYSQENANAPIDINTNINQRSSINQQSSGDTIECPYCAEVIKKNAKICRYCNNRL